MTFKHNLPNAFPNFQFNNQLVVETKIATNPQKSTFKPKKAGINGTHCFMILDESGSMSSVRKDTIGGVNTFIDKQKEDKDNTKLTIVKFEGGHVRIPIDGIDIKEIGTFTDYQPAGGTNLLDAVGLTMTKINDLLAKSKKKDRPSIFIQIITDGEENQSKNYIKEEIQGMVSAAGNADWVITYVGANVDAFSEAAKLGIHSSATSNYKTSNMADTFTAMASSTTRMKSMRSMGVTANQMYNTGAVYTSVEKDLMEK